MPSVEKNTALAIMALVNLRPQDPLLPKAVRWLMDHRRGAGWQNTQATAFAVLGLAGYIRVAGELQSDFSYELHLNDKVIASGQVTPGSQPIEPVVIGGDGLLIGDNHLQLEIEGQGKLYYAALLRQQLYYDGFEPVASSDRG